MNYAAAFRELWRHHELGRTPQDYAELVRYATMAASSHNTQPWQFKPHSDSPGFLATLLRRGSG